MRAKIVPPGDNGEQSCPRCILLSDKIFPRAYFRTDMDVTLPGFMQQDFLPVQCLSRQDRSQRLWGWKEGERAEAIPWGSAEQGCFAHSHSPLPGEQAPPCITGSAPHKGSGAGACKSSALLHVSSPAISTPHRPGL